MPAGTTILFKRKAGAFSNGELQAGEMGIDTTNGRVYFSINGTTVTQLERNEVPVGTILPYVGATPPSGYLFCAGQSVNVADYPTLALLIGQQYQATSSIEVTTSSGSSNIYFGFNSPRPAPVTNPAVGAVFSLKNPEDFGLTMPSGMSGLPVAIVSASGAGPFQIALTFGGTPLVATANNTSPEAWDNLSFASFGLPDLRGRSIFGRDNMNASDANRLAAQTSDGDILGVSGGAETHLLLSTESGVPAHAHNYNDSTPVSANTRGAGASATMTSATLTGRTTSENTAADAASAHNNMPPFLVANWIIRAL
jgi:microcystin-dependent protein